MTTSGPSTARSLGVWGAAMAAYVVAILHRTSFGVAGLETADRFGVSAAVLASLAVAQLVVYAALQVPVGVLLDRVGPRALIATGALLMAGGQLVLAFATVVPAALTARMLIGAGDAMTFVCVIRLVPAWFPYRRVPLMTQLTGGIGQLGQVLAAVPLVAVLHGPGWGPAFGGLAAVGVFAAILVAVAVRDTPRSNGRGAEGRVLPARGPGRAPWLRLGGAAGQERARDGLRKVVGDPGVRLGFWIHFLGQFSSHTIVLLWGLPFFLEGQGRTTAEASALLTANVVAAVAAGPVIGELTARHPERRTRLALVVAAGIALAWLMVLVPSRPLPLGVLMVFMVVVAIGGPTSLVGFDVARSSTPPHRLGTATGLVNTGGFVAALSTMLAVGVVLDQVAPEGARDLAAYRHALAVVVVPWTVGVVGVLVSRRRTRVVHPDIAL